MSRPRIIAAILAAALAASPAAVQAGPAPATPGKTFGLGATGWIWGIFGCSGGIILSAAIANWTQKRPLTWNEAATCGLLFWFAAPKTR